MSKPNIKLTDATDFPEFLLGDGSSGERDFVIHCHSPRYIVEIKDGLNYSLHCIDPIPEGQRSWRVAQAIIFFNEMEDQLDEETIEEAIEEERRNRADGRN